MATAPLCDKSAAIPAMSAPLTPPGDEVSTCDRAASELERLAAALKACPNIPRYFAKTLEMFALQMREECSLLRRQIH